MGRITATYMLETPYDMAKSVETLAREQSTGTFIPLPGETESLRMRHGARVESLEPLEPVLEPSLPSALDLPQGVPYNRAMATISFPLENIGSSLPNLVATVAGGVFDLGQFTAARLVSLDIPQEFTGRYPGPGFGIEGTRALSGVPSGPIIGTILKPSVGLTPGETAARVKELALAGIDFIKDDECMGNPPHSPLKDRVAAVMRAVDEAADTTGRKLMYAFNITDDLDLMLGHHDTVLEAGGTCVMVSINPVGLTGFSYLRRHSALPIHAHRNGWGMMSRYPNLGMDFQPYHAIWRLAGVDQLHCSGFANKFWDSDADVARAARACLSPFLGLRPVMPVLSSGQWALQAPQTHSELGSTDLMYVCGGGIVGHPDGLAAGVASVRQAWEAAVGGIDPATHAADHPELRRALEVFGK